jgi:signal peptidase I
MDIPDSDINYFYLFPGKKQFVKRLMGKPGDTLYFYGGKIYGIDQNGNELTELRNGPWAQNLEHIPFMQLEGRVELASSGGGRGVAATFFQMNQPVAKVMAHPLGWLEGEVFGKDGKTLAINYSDLWGIKNYAKTRLLTLAQVKELYPKIATTLEEGVLYLELTHHPSVRDAKIVQEGNRHRPGMGTSVSLLPLQQKHLERLSAHMTTCRFVVKHGMAHRLGQDQYPEYFPQLLGIPDGTYEIQDGVASQVYFGGITHQLSKDHPLYKTDPVLIQKLYNLGIEFLTVYEPSKEAFLTPSRYAYFRDGALCLFNAPIVFANEAPLQNFLKRELEKKKVSTSKRPYLPFIDEGAPLKADGSLDVELIRRYGLTIPEKKYLMLGDNHPMSADSRVYGFVGEDNIKGTVRFLFSPPGQRWGTLPQPSAEYWTLPTFIVWTSALSCAVGYYLYRRRRLRQVVGGK